jgi:hypothetical protein
LKITDREFKGLFRRMNNIIINNNVNTGNNTVIPNDNEDILKQIKDDDYYMERKGLIPPRFHYYNHVKSELFGASGYLYITQDELDFGLKRILTKVSPEQRYQAKKSSFLFHDLSCYMNHINDHDYNEDGSLKGCTGEGCIPQCEYYPETGRIEDQQVIEEHRESERYYRNKNQIINIDINEKDFLKFLKEHLL